ncbi:hypothetical protein K0I63_11765 [Shewanella rhizosphaerae]|uniref:hypothetical protein n=1 Tax=Shewanella rhizosphaerae TaxID=2864207 RepID=UPI001C65A8D7|nr:hypothetical protein [Shewanella rhizosphaerae]QYK11466.1 hypothetical protein K0I63_11765 [Shewanella rhizosphaerae]
MSKLLIFVIFLSWNVFAEEQRFKHYVAGFDTELEVRTFLSKIRESVLTGNYEKIASLMSFPTRLYVGDELKVVSKEEFIRFGNQIINERIFRAVYCSSYENLKSNYQGIMIGSGEIWITKIKDKEEDPWETVIWKINNKPFIGEYARRDGECFYSAEVNKLFNSGQN